MGPRRASGAPPFFYARHAGRETMVRPRVQYQIVTLLAALSVAWAPATARAQFTAITKQPLGNNGSAFGFAWGDFDRDGDLDLYVANDGPNLFIRNDGGGTFTDVTAPPVDNGDNGGSAAWGDYDDDGDLDLYLVNYLTANKLFRNDGAAFTDVTS